ncbi:MAG: hypothetical protein JSV96_01405 [Candidatus Aminicenantes bacterium]|nr:MAG: hypothetical protein JSV96_01405 [Candidatus Aminicenantes bacterium]
MKKIILCFTLLIFISCASTPVIYRSLSDTSYPSTTKVDVYKKEKPTKEYIEIGRIEIKEQAEKENKVYELAIKKAKEVGADGIILVSDETSHEYVQLLKDTITSSGDVVIKRMIFIAIKYVEKK